MLRRVDIIITYREQIIAHHAKTSKIDLADAKYDEHHNYQFSRSHESIPIIDYSPRNENMTAAEGPEVPKFILNLVQRE